MGHGGGWWVPPKQKYTVRYGLSPYAQNPMKGALHNAIFNTFRRVKGQLLFVVLPVGSYLYLWNWANEYNTWLYSKDGHETLSKLV